jgi:hypothetical protein
LLAVSASSCPSPTEPGLPSIQPPAAAQTRQKHSRQQLLGHSAGHLKQRSRETKRKNRSVKRSRSEKGEGREADLKTKKEKRKQTCLLRFWVFAGNEVAHSRQEGEEGTKPLRISPALWISRRRVGHLIYAIPTFPEVVLCNSLSETLTRDTLINATVKYQYSLFIEKKKKD